MDNHRTPPKPAWFDEVSEGTCRWCNEKIGPTRTGRASKAHWHKECYEEYELLFHASTTRQAVWKRDHGKCRSCGKQCDRKGANGWDMDHITPLIEANGEMKYWTLENLQTLCKPCHKAKTSAEATQRALARKTKPLN
ncbi:HNH endonuclease [Acinetobacter sp.]|uniref:HNH endonuclease n=1 Tax=Acinetobacter sp. TaxID=472 RepID=UPI00388F5D30